MPIIGANKENVQMTTKDVVNRLMGPASKLTKKQAKSKNQNTSKLQDADLDRQFEELMVCFYCFLFFPSQNVDVEFSIDPE